MLVDRALPVDTGVNSVVAQLFLNPQKLVIFRCSFTSARRSGFNLSASETNNQISDESVFSFAASVADHDAPALFVTHGGCFDGFGQGSDLVDFQEQRVARFLVDSCLDSGWVGDEEIVADNLDFGADGCGERGLERKCEKLLRIG